MGKAVEKNNDRYNSKGEYRNEYREDKGREYKEDDERDRGYRF